VNNYRSGIIPN